MNCFVKTFSVKKQVRKITPAAKTVATYLELFIILFTLKINYSKVGYFNGSVNDSGNSILEECLIIPHSSHLRNNNYPSDERSQRTNENELFIFNKLTHTSKPDYTVMLSAVVLLSPQKPAYILSTDEKSPPNYFL